MGWVKLDDGFFRHPKVVRAGRDGRVLYIAGLCWCSSQLTDGVIAAEMLPLLAFDAGVPVDDAAVASDRLVEVGLWERAPEGWVVHDYVEHQRTREQVEHEREQARERQARRRLKLTAVSRRDSRDGHGDVTQPDKSQIRGDKRTTSPLQNSVVVSQGGPGGRTDDDDGVRSITDEIGQRRFDAAIRSGQVTRNAKRYRDTCKDNAWLELAADVRSALDAGATPEQITDDHAPVPTTSRAAAARARQNGAT